MPLVSLAPPPHQLFCGSRPRLGLKLKYLRFQRNLSSLASTFTSRVSSSKFQLYRSCSHDPYFNLAVERYLFEKSPPESIILLFYVNRPCVVIGRNQNPWLEANLPRLCDNPLRERVDLVRRRSGGGTVFHDHGNVNFSVIRPPAGFMRDGAVDMVARALRPEEPRAAVNERHDIVLQGEGGARKVSGSAYKLSRTRAMHHATCLIDSPNLELISSFLRSPAAPYIKAKGVESVPSPVANLFPGRGERGIVEFVRKVVSAFSEQYGLGFDCGASLAQGKGRPFVHVHAGSSYGLLDEELLGIDLVKGAMQDLLSPSWIFGSTPAFSFSSSAPTEQQHELLAAPPRACEFNFSARGGAITEASLRFPDFDPNRRFDVTDWEGSKLYDVQSWKDSFAELETLDGQPPRSVEALNELASWLHRIAGFARLER